MTLAVLTGDIVRSSMLSQEQLSFVMNELNRATLKIATWSNGCEANFARRGGDAWQVTLNKKQYSFRAALFVQACIRRMDDWATRIAIAEGAGAFPDPQRPDPNSGFGEAFTESGRLLNSLPKHRLMNHSESGSKAAAVILADHISQGWTQAQARALFEVIPPKSGTRSEAAERLGISRQAVDQAVHAAGWPALEAALTAWETA